MPEKYENLDISESSFRLKLVLGLFLAGLIFAAVYTDIGILRYKITGKPDLSYWTSDADADNFEAQYTACFPFKLFLLSANGGINRAMGEREMNDVVRMNNGYLTALMVQVPEERLRAEADKVAALQEWLESRGIPFLYVAGPVKSNEKDPELPAGDVDYTNANLNIFLDELDRKGVNYLDLRKEMEKDGMNSYDWFYHTDHHWTTRAGFWAYGKIENWLVDATGITVDPQVTDLNNYQIDRYEKIMLGSRGKRVGLLYGGVDDFEMITPKFETSLTDVATGKTGTFQELLVKEDYLKNHETDYLRSDIYDLTLQGSTHVVNNKSANDANIIFITDSFGFTVQQYLALTTSRLDEISAYTPQGVSQLAGEGGVNPEAVILLQCPVFNLGVDTSFDFGIDGAGQ